MLSLPSYISRKPHRVSVHVDVPPSAICALQRAHTCPHLRTGARTGCVVGISFDATCSLVVLGPADAPVTVSTSGEPHRNIIQWRDHRAIKQATRVTNGSHRMLDYVGGVVSPEHEVAASLRVCPSLRPSARVRARPPAADSRTHVHMGAGAEAHVAERKPPYVCIHTHTHTHTHM